MNEEILEKQRILHDLQIQMQTKVEQRTRLAQETDLSREEYYQLKDELDQLAYTLRFSIEEELKIYEALLNSVERKTSTRVLIVQSNDYRPLKKCVNKTTESTKYQIAQSMLGLNRCEYSLEEEKNVRQQQHYEKKTAQWEDRYMQRRIRINRRYLGKIIREIV